MNNNDATRFIRDIARNSQSRFAVFRFKVPGPEQRVGSFGSKVSDLEVRSGSGSRFAGFGLELRVAVPGSRVASVGSKAIRFGIFKMETLSGPNLRFSGSIFYRIVQVPPHLDHARPPAGNGGLRKPELVQLYPLLPNAFIAPLLSEFQPFDLLSVSQLKYSLSKKSHCPGTDAFLKLNNWVRSNHTPIHL